MPPVRHDINMHPIASRISAQGRQNSTPFRWELPSLFVLLGEDAYRATADAVTLLRL